MMTKTFGVLARNRESVEGALTRLVKRAARKGLPGTLTWTWGKAFKAEVEIANIDGVPPCASATLSHGSTHWVVPVMRIPLTIEGETPSFNGWRFVASLQHLDNENIVRALPGETIPTEYRTRGPVCDHCRAARRRNDTFVLAHEATNRTVQVGSTCIRDFLGSNEAEDIASLASILAEARSFAGFGESEFGFGGGGEYETPALSYLTMVAWCVRTLGWVSKAKAEENGSDSTSDIAWELLQSPRLRAKNNASPSQEDINEAAAAEAWAENLSDEAINNETSDYLHNLRAAARTGLVSSRTKGILASLIVAHQKATAPKSTGFADTFVGTVDTKVTFGLPAKTGKKGQPLKNAPVVLSDAPVTLDFVAGYETMYGYTTVLKFKTADGACLVWKASSTNLGRKDIGKTFTLAGTIKAHEEYKGQKQTILSRCTVSEVAPETTADAA